VTRDIAFDKSITETKVYESIIKHPRCISSLLAVISEGIYVSWQSSFGFSTIIQSA